MVGADPRHGLGSLFLLAFAGGLAGLYSLRPQLITAEGVVERMRRLKVGIRVDDDIRTVQLPITALTLVVVLAFLRRGGLHRLGGVALVALYAAFLLSLPAG